MAQLEPVGSGPTSYQIIPIFRPRLAERPNIQLQKTFFDYTGCTLKLRAVKLLFVIFGRLSYTFFIKIMVLGNGRLSYIL